jgi:hypothetical protein
MEERGIFCGIVQFLRQMGKKLCISMIIFIFAGICHIPYAPAWYLFFCMGTCEMAATVI